MTTRQQKRAKARAPLKKKRRGQSVFVAVLLILMVGSGFTAFLFRGQERKLTRGAIQGEHWHADYAIEICGKKIAAYPFVEGEIHTHNDGRVHLHPQTARFTLANANLGKFFDSVESRVGVENGKRFIQFPNGEKFQDGGTCPGGGSTRYDVEVTLNGDRVETDPSRLVLHDGDAVRIRFGPRATSSTANPIAGTPRPQSR